jgi:hypothetical protein
LREHEPVHARADKDDCARAAQQREHFAAGEDAPDGLIVVVLIGHFGDVL